MSEGQEGIEVMEWAQLALPFKERERHLRVRYSFSFREVLDFYLGHFWELTKVRFEKALLDRVMVYLRNMQLVRLSFMDPVAFASWNTAWKTSRTLVRNINASKSFLKAASEETLVPRAELFQCWALSMSLIWGSFVLSSNLGLLGKTPGFALAYILAEVTFIVRQLDGVMVESSPAFNRFESRVKTVLQTFIILANMAVISLGAMPAQARLLLVTLAVVGLETVGWLAVRARMEERFEPLRIARDLSSGRLTPGFREAFWRVFRASLPGSLGAFITNYAGSQIAALGDQRLKDRGLYVQNNLVSTQFWLGWNIIDVFVHTVRKELDKHLSEVRQHREAQAYEARLYKLIQTYYYLVVVELTIFFTLLWGAAPLLSLAARPLESIGLALPGFVRRSLELVSSPEGRMLLGNYSSLALVWVVCSPFDELVYFWWPRYADLEGVLLLAMELLPVVLSSALGLGWGHYACVAVTKLLDACLVLGLFAHLAVTERNFPRQFYARYARFNLPIYLLGNTVRLAFLIANRSFV